MKNKKTFRILLFVSLALILAAGAFGGANILNNKWEKENGNWVTMKVQIAEDNPQVKRVNRLDSGPCCIINLVMKTSCSFDQAEAIFTDV